MQTHTLRLILGDQLNPGHSWFTQIDPHVVYVLMEVRQETDYVLHSSKPRPMSNLQPDARYPSLRPVPWWRST